MTQTEPKPPTIEEQEQAWLQKVHRRTREQMVFALAERVKKCPRDHTRPENREPLPEWVGVDAKSSSGRLRYGPFGPFSEKGLQELDQVQRNYWDGYQDVDQHQWCWQCSARGRLYDFASIAGFPAIPRSQWHHQETLPEWYPEGCEDQGPAFWLGLASHCDHLLLDGLTKYFLEGPGKEVIADL